MKDFIIYVLYIGLLATTFSYGYYFGKSNQLEKYIQVQVQDYPETIDEADKKIIKQNK